MNNARRISPPMRNAWLGEGRDRGEQRSECCAKCRRGVKEFGEMPCGYDRKCPNECHEKAEEEN
jgi:hypothetical protein